LLKEAMVLLAVRRGKRPSTWKREQSSGVLVEASAILQTSSWTWSPGISRL
jgi:hypothetical protein